MNKICRFCKQSSISLLFPASKKKLAKKAVEFTCTNCGFGQHGIILRCANCQIIYVDEKISQQKISAYYEIAEDPLYLSEQPARQITFNRYLQKLEKIYPQKGNLLDIGTNTGLFVYVAQKNGWDAIGIEPNRWGVNYARRMYKINIINKSFTANTFTPESFNVITMWDVIEHFTNPPEEMRKVYRCLKTGGVFAFSTVDPNSLFAKIMGTRWSWYMEMHRVLLGRAAAKRFLLEAGFKRIIFQPHWRNLSLGYLGSRLQAIDPNLEKIATKLITVFGLGKVIVPYYANDLYDCYAFK